jgi:hypothetical protein
MPIEYQIDSARQLIEVQGRGVLTDQDVFEYQQTVGSRPDLAGYDELMDMRAVERIDLPSADRARQLAALSASMDAGRPSKLAIVAAQDLAYGLGRMYQVYRDLQKASTKEVGVFRTLAEALAFLGIGGDAPNPGQHLGQPGPR